MISDYLKIIFCFFFISMLSNGQQLTCSALASNKNKTLLRKNLDWDLGNGLIVFNPKYKAKKSVVIRKPIN